ncbi:MAG TPA: sodium:solute symporter family protein [Caldithrix abyssi]|uniref:Sodium:solute symporter family protein n=1 Tax=Caldithrix abyssi TaxID=187145 RepID=A0A7V5RN43_CALAY|nr:sodium:solute symporter family protein [Caldithrix abyssi]
MSAYFWYWTGFITYSIVVIAIGFRVFLREKQSGLESDNSEFWTASRSLSGWAIGLSISASMMSISWSGMYGVQLFYWYGVGGMWLLIIPWLVNMALFYWLAPRFRQLNVFSQPELMQKRYGNSARLIIAATLLFVFIAWGGAEVYAAGQIIAPFLGITPQTTYLFIALVVAAYSYTGGFAAVVSTDKIQFALVALFMAAIAWLAWGQADWSMDTLLSLSPPKQEAGMWVAPGITLILLTAVAYLPGWLVETDLWIRLQSARSHAEARKGIVVASVNSLIFVGIAPAIIGLSALQLFPPVDGVIPAYLNDGALIFSEVLSRYAPAWLSLVLSIGLIAAAMSTIDTCSNIVALSLSRDIVEPVLMKRKPDAAAINRLARLSSVFAVLLSYLYALFTDSLWDIFYLSSGLLTTVVAIPVISTFFKKINSRQVVSAMGTGLISTFIFYFLEKFDLLQSLEPAAIADTGLGYILWAFLLSLLALFAAGM